MKNKINTTYPQPTIGNSEPNDRFDKKKNKFVKIIVPGDMLEKDQEIIFHFKMDSVEVLTSPRLTILNDKKQFNYNYPANKVPDGVFSISYSVYDESGNIGSSLELDEEFFTGSFQNIAFELSDNCFMKQWGGFNFYNSDPVYREIAASGGGICNSHVENTKTYC
ncbi:TPA: hypothetical protein PP061_003934 [Salmonella bongori]|nr:hypothetical protein [Salmonella bongori]